MLRWSRLEDVPDLGSTVVTLGNFDGVHRGHRAVLDRVVAEATARNAVPIAVTFDPHPIAVLFPERAPHLIASIDQRVARLQEAGMAGVLVLTFTRELAAQTPEQFVRETFVDALRAACVVVGEDTRFGVRNSGDVDTLRSLGAEHGFDVVALADVGDQGRWSSTKVRDRLLDGDVAGASSMLGHDHRVTGIVVHGDHRGRELGYPTANLGQDSEGLIPADGVYAGWLTRLDLPESDDGRRLPAAISVGTNPTFDGHQRRVEAYVLDRTDLDLYGDRIAVDFVEFLRPTLKFDSLDALLERMAEDVERTRAVLAADATGR